MDPLTIIENPNVLEYRFLGFFPCFKVLLIEPFLLQLAPEAFHGSIVPTVPLTAHAAPETIGFQQFLIVPGTVLAAAIGIMPNSG